MRSKSGFLVKSEKHKMLAGDWYNPRDSKLTALRLAAKQRCYDFNQLSPAANSQRKALLQQLLKVNARLEIEAPFFCDYGFNISLGVHFYANHGCTILDAAKVTIGDDCLLGPGVVLSTVNHPLDAEQRLTGVEQALPITLGNNVWLAANVTVTAGVTIGDDVVVGAGSVVLHDLPARTLCAGTPAKVIKKLSKP